MPLTRNENQLLLNATTQLGEAYQKSVVDILKSLIETADWVGEYLFYALKKGVTFEFKDDNESWASYLVDKKKIVFLRSITPIALEKTHVVAKDMFSLALRHELTHAYDFLKNAEHESAQKKVVTNLMRSQSISNGIINKLTCLDYYLQVNHKVLDDIYRVTSQWNNSASRTMYESHDLLTGINTHNAISNYGSCPIDRLAKNYSIEFNGYISSMSMLGGSTTKYLYEFTWNTHRIWESFNNKKNYRDENNITHHERNFLIGARTRQLWKGLSLQQTTALESLYMFRHRLYGSIAKGDRQNEFCYPALNDCIAGQNQDCFDTFIACQRDNSNDGDVFLRSLFESNAVLRERMNGHLITHEMLDNLCPLPTVMINAEKEIKPYRANNRYESNNYESNSNNQESPVFLYAIMNAFTFSFLDSVIESLLIFNDAKNIPKWKTLFNIAYILFVYAILNLQFEEDNQKSYSAWQALFSIALILFKNSLTLRETARNTLNAGIFLSQVVTQGPIPTMGGYLIGYGASKVGGMCANSMSHAFGWKNFHLVFMQEIQKIIDTDDIEKFRPFLNAIKEKLYSKALRIACTSTDSKALTLVKLLISNAKALSIKDISEQAGADNRSALHYAALKGNDEVYAYLLKMGALDKVDIHGKTACEYYAIAKENLQPKIFQP